MSDSHYRACDALRAALVALAFLAQPVAATAPVASVGQPVIEVISALEARGLTIIYSNDLVDPAMTVRAAPTTSDPVALLREVLQPYGLALLRGPRAAWLIVRAAARTAPPPVALSGVVTDADSAAPVGRAVVRVLETGQSTMTNAGGEFGFTLPAAGRYRVAVAAPDYAVEPPRLVDVPGPPLAFELRARVLPIETIVVSASYYTLAREPSASTSYLNRTQLANLPTLGEDALRATQGLPGIASSGVSARSNVRGGEPEETLLRLDGMRLYNPFHFRDFESLFSSIDPAVIDGMEIRTGGYPAPYGDRMSGVVDMHSIIPTGERTQELRVTLLNSGVLSSGRFDADRGDWVASLRRSNLDLLVRALDPSLGEPEYFDFFGKGEYALDEHWQIAGNVLLSKDDVRLEDPPVAHATATYRDAYYWLRLEHTPNERFAGHYLVSQTQLSDDHDGFLNDPGRAIGTLSEGRDASITALSADWLYHISERQLLSFGAELRNGNVHYVHAAQATFPDPILFDGSARTGLDTAFDTRVDGEQRAAYASYRRRWPARITTEIGLRWDQQSYTGQTELSPRANLLVDLGPHTQLRAAAGRYYQSQGLEELQINDGVSTFYSAQEAQHLVLGIEHRFEHALHLQLELYDKQFDHLRPRFENLYTRLDLLPELQPDRVRIDPEIGASKGVELALEQEVAPWRWWANVAWSSVKDRIDGRWVPRSWDQRWSVNAGFIRTGTRWTAAASAAVHGGWPSTALQLVDGQLVAGAFNAERVRSFQSLDLRVSRRIALARGQLDVFLEVINALDHANPCCLAYDLESNGSGGVTLETDFDDWLPLVPSVGVVWRF